jgi:hypothetical protein
MNIENQLKTSLTKVFLLRHVTATIKHYSASVEKYQGGDWESCISKGGKFIEAVMKSLWVYCGQVLPPSRQFKVGNIAKRLEQLGGQTDTVRLLIPRACVFTYDIASNRGARHDPYEMDSNKMDATAVVNCSSWIFAELVRFSESGTTTPESVIELVEGLIEKKYPHLEDIDGRLYINLRGLSPREAGLLILNGVYPNRISKNDLADSLKRHGYKRNPIAIAMTRLKAVVDDYVGQWKLRGIGRQEADAILSRHRI